MLSALLCLIAVCLFVSRSGSHTPAMMDQSYVQRCGLLCAGCAIGLLRVCAACWRCNTKTECVLVTLTLIQRSAGQLTGRLASTCNSIHSVSEAWGHRGQGLPFCVAGVGDLLALFRCISCRYCFGTNIDKPDLLGAPGRVFTTMEVSGAPSPAWDCAVCT